MDILKVAFLILISTDIVWVKGKGTPSQSNRHEEKVSSEKKKQTISHLDEESGEDDIHLNLSNEEDVDTLLNLIGLKESGNEEAGADDMVKLMRLMSGSEENSEELSNLLMRMGEVGNQGRNEQATKDKTKTDTESTSNPKESAKEDIEDGNSDNEAATTSDDDDKEATDSDTGETCSETNDDCNLEIKHEEDDFGFVHSDKIMESLMNFFGRKPHTEEEGKIEEEGEHKEEGKNEEEGKDKEEGKDRDNPNSQCDDREEDLEHFPNKAPTCDNTSHTGE